MTLRKQKSINFEMDMCHGSILPKLVVYALPLLATNVLQLLFNVADTAVLGRFVDYTAVAAVGSTGSLINLIIGLFVGLSVGANVLVARSMGEDDMDKSARTVGMSMLLSVVIGIVLGVIGFCGAETFLRWMKCDVDVLEMATKYLKIYFIGMPMMMVYNFAASILRAVGDTMRPLIYLVIGGVLNVGLNLYFVIVLKKDVEGVAVATVASQTVSAVLCVITLIKTHGFCHLDFSHFRIYKDELATMTQIGLPAGLQGCVFSISNVLIQSEVNTHLKVAMAANSVASLMDGLIYNAMYSVALATLAFVSQNYGAKKGRRIRRTVWLSLFLVVAVGVVVGALVLIFDEQLCRIITDEPEVIEIACTRTVIMATTYFTCGIMDVMSNTMRGLGKSTLAMIISMSGVCLFRIIWINTVYAWTGRGLETLYWAYPVSWVLTSLIYFGMFFPTMKKIEKKFGR